MKQSIAGIILAGGLSRRMGGGDKPLVMLEGRPLLAHVMDRLQGQVGAVAINANGDPARLAAFARPVVQDSVEGFAGPLAGILAGLEWASASTDARRILTVAADSPFFPMNLADRLFAATEGREQRIAVACSAGRRHPTFALWPVGLAASLRSALLDEDERKVGAFIDRHDHVEVDFELQQIANGSYDPFFNVNTPSDLTEAARLAQAMRS